MSELSEDTLIKIKPRTAYSIAAMLITLGGIYFMLKGNVSDTQKLKEDVEDIKSLVLSNEKFNRDARDEIKENEKQKHNKLEKDLRDFFQAEIDGLRVDWERRYRDNINPRIIKLEK